jgi:putative FmdB family regulatory protein
VSASPVPPRTRSAPAVPTYQYVCANPEDKHEFEVVQSFSDPSVTECPQCGSPVRKVYGSVGVVFKGSGFYRTDSRVGSSSGGSSSGTAAKKESSSESSSSSTSSSSSSSGSGSSATSAGSKAAD